MTITVNEAHDLADTLDAEGRAAAEQGYANDALECATIRDALLEVIEYANDDEVELDDALADVALDYI